jgi:hypothetical protein
MNNQKKELIKEVDRLIKLGKHLALSGEFNIEKIDDETIKD